jgi:hypothetical protein
VRRAPTGCRHPSRTNRRRRIDGQIIRIEAVAAVQIIDGADLKRIRMKCEQRLTGAREAQRAIGDLDRRGAGHERNRRRLEVVAAPYFVKSWLMRDVWCAVMSTGTSLLT